jgi:hypothetical protein
MDERKVTVFWDVALTDVSVALTATIITAVVEVVKSVHGN